jgi:hypothetical protein
VAAALPPTTSDQGCVAQVLGPARPLRTPVMMAFTISG